MEFNMHGYLIFWLNILMCKVIIVVWMPTILVGPP